MQNGKVKVKVIGNLALFSIFIYLILVGQKNLGPVKWIARILVTTNVRPIGICIMIVALIGLLLQLYCYNKKYQ